MSILCMLDFYAPGACCCCCCCCCCPGLTLEFSSRSCHSRTSEFIAKSSHQFPDFSKNRIFNLNYIHPLGVISRSILVSNSTNKRKKSINSVSRFQKLQNLFRLFFEKRAEHKWSISSRHNVPTLRSKLSEKLINNGPIKHLSENLFIEMLSLAFSF